MGPKAPKNFEMREREPIDTTSGGKKEKIKIWKMRSSEDSKRVKSPIQGPPSEIGSQKWSRKKRQEKVVL